MPAERARARNLAIGAVRCEPGFVADLSRKQRPEKARWLSGALPPEVLVIDSVNDGWPALGRVNAEGGWVQIAFHLSLVIDSGEGRDDPDESRIEPPIGKSITAPPGAIPLVIGVLAGDPTPRTIVVWDGRPRQNLPTRGSLYSKWSAVRLAADKGYYEHVNANGERVVALDVDRLPHLVAELARGGLPAAPPAPHVLSPPAIGVPFVARAVRKRKPADPFAVDPERVERGTVAHEQTLSALGSFLQANGRQPLAPAPDDPEFDLAWTDNAVTYVAEVKSVTDANEDKQLRLGLGQALWYRHLLAVGGRQVRAVLVAEREPRDARWREVCSGCGVLLTWPERFADIFAF